MSDMLLPKSPRARSKAHLEWVSTLPCCACGRQGQTQAHHLMFAQLRARGMKVSDEFAVPACTEICHRGIHARGDEKAWWNEIGVDPIAISQELWARSIKAGRAHD